MTIRNLMTLPLLLAFAACGNDPADHNHEGNNEAANGHEQKHAENEHGARKELGSKTAFERTFKVVQYGDVKAGAEAAFELEFAAGKDRIDTVRGWIGEKSGKGSMKSMWQLEGETNLHGHVEVPKELLDSAQLWMELELGDKTETISIAFQ